MRKRMIIVFSVILACAVLLSGCESKADRYFSEGFEAFENGEYKTAERKLRKAIDSGCERTEADEIIEIIDVYEKISKYLNNNEYDKALEAMESVPDSYEDYAIAEEFDSMEEILSKAAEASDIADMIMKRYEDGEYDTALNLADYVDYDYLSSSQKAEIDKIKTDIESDELSRNKKKPDSQTSGKSERTEGKDISEDNDKKEDEKKNVQSENTGSVRYRVRKSPEDADSQIGAFSELDNAKRLADVNAGYGVYDMNGSLIYQP